MEPAFVLPAPKIKEEEDALDVIDLDGYKTPEDIVYEWNSRIRMKIKNHFIVDNEQTLDSLMKWYIQMIKEEAVNFEDFRTLKSIMANHVQLFKLYFIELNCCFMDNYLDNMEEILTFYSNIEIQSLPVRQRDSNKRAYKKLLTSVCRKIISMLNDYLINKEDRVYHVVMKIELNLHSDGCKELLNLVYGNLLTEEPRDKSDLKFCRAYILYQKWKTIRKPEDWNKMDEVMYSIYNRTPEVVKENVTLRQILFPQNNSILDTLIHISEKHIIISDAYFKFIKSTKIQEDNIVPEISNIDLQDEIIPELINADESQEFDKAYNNFVKTISNIPDTSSNIKIEEENEDDDCQIVASSSFVRETETESNLLMHEIIEDDLEIIYLTKKEEQLITTPNNKKSIEVSFSESIEVAEHPVAQTENISSDNSPSVLPSVNRSMSTSTSTLILQPVDKSNNVATEKSSPISQDDVLITPENANSTEQTSDNGSKSNTKSVTNIETQTDDFTEIINANNLSNCNCNDKVIENSQLLERHTHQNDTCRKFYPYGLVTPPSDQPLYDHSTLITESTSYPNLYANIVRTNNSLCETDGITKVSENDYLPSSFEDSVENSNSQLPSSSGNTDGITATDLNKSNVGDQLISQSDENRNVGVEIEPDIPGKKDNMLDFENENSSHCEQALDKLVTTNENIDFNNDYNESASKNLDSFDIHQNHDSHFISESCTTEEVTGSQEANILPVCMDIDISSRSSSHIQGEFSSDVAAQSPPPPNQQNDIFKTPVVSPNVQSTSTDFIVSSQNFALSLQNKDTNILCTSPDITSTSTEIQDYHEHLSNQESDNHVGHAILNSDMPDVEDSYINNNKGYCLEEYVETSECHRESEEFRNNENVSQSNLQDGVGAEEIFIEEPVIVNNEEEFFIIEELPIGANVNICTYNIDSNLVNPDGHEILEDRKLQTKLNNNKNGTSTSHPKREKLDIGSSDDMVCKNTIKSPRKIMFTSSEKIDGPIDEFSKFEETIHLRWNQSNTHDLDDIFCGPVSKVNSTNDCINPDTSFDLFGNSKQVPSSSSSVKCTSPANSSGEVTSPPYEPIDDFRSYCEENKGNDMLGVSPSQRELTEEKIINSTTMLNKQGQYISKSYKNPKTSEQLPSKNVNNAQITESDGHNLLGNSVSADTYGKQQMLQRKSQNNVRRPRIAFAKNIIVESNTISHPTTGTNNVLQGILRKPSSGNESILQTGKRVTRPRIPRRLMNLKSLQQYNVKPNDPCLQRVPCVVIERLSDIEISQWLRLSEISRKVRLQKQQAQYASSEIIYRIDYDKNTPQINENDIIQYNTPKGLASISLPQKLGQWRSNTNLQSKSSKLEEGIVTSFSKINFNDNEYDSRPSQCQNVCCNSLTADLTNLNVSRPASDTILNFNCCNPPPNLKCNIHLSNLSKPHTLFKNAKRTTDSNVPTIYEDLNKQCRKDLKLEVTNSIGIEAETRLPLKKRKRPKGRAKVEMDEDAIGPDLVEDIIKRARAEKVEKEDISYPAEPMLSIAEVHAKLVTPLSRAFKTPAEKKEMPPPPGPAYLSPPETKPIFAEHYNNHTYNNPTINYHMNNLPYPFFPCASLSYFPPILLPVNSTTGFDINLGTTQPSATRLQQPPMEQEHINLPRENSRRERKGKTRKKNKE